MKTKITLLLLLVSAILFAQSNEDKFNWAFNTGGGSNFVQRIKYNSQGDLIVLGGFYDKGKFGTTALGAVNNTFLATQYIGKRTPSGVMSVLHSRSKVAGGIGFVYDDFDIDGNDNIYLAGIKRDAFSAPLDFGNGVTISGEGYIIVKFNSNGVAQWVKMIDFGNTSNLNLFKSQAIQVLPTGDIMFACQSNSGTKPFRISKYNTSGTELWHKDHTFSSNATLAVESSKQNCNFDNVGNSYFFISIFNSASLVVDGVDTITIPSPSNISSFVLNFDSAGDKKQYFGLNGDFDDVAVDKTSGNVFFKALTQVSTNGSPFNTLPLSFGSYFGIVLLDNQNNYLKASTFDVLSTNPLTSSKSQGLLPISSETFIFAAKLSNNNPATYIAGTQSYLQNSNSRVFCIESDTNLNPKNFVTAPSIINNPNSGDLYPKLALNNGKVAIAGNWNRTDNLTISINGTVLTACEQNPEYVTGYPAYAVAGMVDVFVAEYDRPDYVLSNQNFSQNQNFSIYPNPSNGTFNLKIDDEMLGSKATIYSLLGQNRTSFEVTNNVVNQNLASGIYVLEIEKNGQKLTQKLIIK